MKYQVKLIWKDGDEMLVDDLYDTEDEAHEGALYHISCCEEGAEILHLSNPGDYEYDEETYEDPDYEIIEIDD